MSDSLATSEVLERPSQGQVERANGQAQSVTDGQTSQDGQSVTDENIRKLQSTYDKKLAEQQRELQATKQAQLQAQQAYQQLQTRLQQMEEAAAPDDYARMELRVKRAEETAQQYAAAYQQAQQEKENNKQFQTAMQEIAGEFDLSPRELEEAVLAAGISGYIPAVKIATQLQKDKERRKQANDNDKRERNAPDLGTGTPRTADSAWDRAYQTARERKDSAEMMRLIRERDGK